MFKIGPRCVVGFVLVVVSVVSIIMVFYPKDVFPLYPWFFVFIFLFIMGALFGAWLDKKAERR